MKLGDDAQAGTLPVDPTPKDKREGAKTTVSMEAIGKGEDEGFYSKYTIENKFSGTFMMDAYLEFVKGLTAQLK